MAKQSSSALKWQNITRAHSARKGPARCRLIPKEIRLAGERGLLGRLGHWLVGGACRKSLE